MRRHGGRTGILTVSLLISLTGCSGSVSLGDASSSPSSSSHGKQGKQNASGARKDLDGLRIASEGSGSGYARDKFGQRWKDTDHNGCDQRNDVLSRDMDSVDKKGSCVVLTGHLNDPYTGKKIDFSKSADAAEVQIDHVYPLALAWRMGAAHWAEDRREQFANDHDNLLAVWGVPNRQKSDKGPSDWKPQKSFQCTYGIKYVAIAKEYSLPVTRPDHDALQDFLGRC